jgi:competence protein ComEA
MRTRTILTLTLALGLTGEALAAGAATAQGAATGPQVNINTATASELALLPRVGPALAQRIIEFRTANGPFKATEELIRVKGIGERSFTLLQPYLAVSGNTTLKEKVRQPRPAKDSSAGAGATR